MFVSKTYAGEIVLSADLVYWCGSGILSKPKAGGAITTVAAKGSCPFALEGHSLFYTVGFTLKELDLQTGRVSNFYTMPSNVDCCGLAVDSDSVYFTDAGSVWRVSRQDRTATRIASGQLRLGELAVGASGVCWIDRSGGGLDQWSGDGLLMAAPLAGGSVRTLASSLVGPGSLALDAQAAYVVGEPITTESIPLLRVPFSGANPVTMVKDISSGGVAVDSAAVYFANREEIERVAKSYKTP